MNIVVSGGGTGGHVNPALAIADIVKAHEPDAEISYVGTSKGIENKLVPAAGYTLYHVEVQGLKRSLSLSNLKTAWMAATSISKAKELLNGSRTAMERIAAYLFEKETITGKEFMRLLKEVQDEEQTGALPDNNEQSTEETVPPEE